MVELVWGGRWGIFGGDASMWLFIVVLFVRVEELGDGIYMFVRGDWLSDCCVVVLENETLRIG